MTRVSAWLLCVYLAIGVGLLADSKKDAKVAFREGQRALKSPIPSDAVDWFEHSVALDPENTNY